MSRIIGVLIYAPRFPGETKAEDSSAKGRACYRNIHSKSDFEQPVDEFSGDKNGAYRVLGRESRPSYMF